MSADAVADDAPSGLDWVFITRGASRGFTVLLLGGVVQPWIGALLPLLGYVWLALVAIVAFFVAARPRHGVPGEVRDCMTAAVGSYLLVLPLVISAAGTFPADQAFFTAMTAVVVGGFTGAYYRWPARRKG